MIHSIEGVCLKWTLSERSIFFRVIQRKMKLLWFSHTPKVEYKNLLQMKYQCFNLPFADLPKAD